MAVNGFGLQIHMECEVLTAEQLRKEQEWQQENQHTSPTDG